MGNIYIRKTGIDSNNGATPNSAVLTIERAVQLINAADSRYDTLIIGSGKYGFGSRYVIIRKDNIKIIGDSTGRLTGDAGKIVIVDQSPEIHGFSVYTCKNLYWENIMITNRHPLHYVFSNNNDTWVFKNCVIGLFGESHSYETLSTYCKGTEIPATFINCTIIGVCANSNLNTANYKKIVNCMIFSVYNYSKTKEINCYRYKLPSELETEKLFTDVSSHDYSLKEGFVNKVMNQGITPEEDSDVPNVDMMGRIWGGKPWIGALISFSNGYLYTKDNEVYGMKDSVMTKLSSDWTSLSNTEKIVIFKQTQGKKASGDALKNLGKFKMLTHHKENIQRACILSAVPKDQLILPKAFISVETFEGVDKTTITETVSGGGVCKIIVTTDLKTYQTYDFETQAWKNVDHTDLGTVKSFGIDAAQFASITRSAWNLILKGKVGLGIAYLMGIEATTDQCAVDKLAAQIDMKGSWAK